MWADEERLSARAITLLREEGTDHMTTPSHPVHPEPVGHGTGPTSRRPERPRTSQHRRRRVLLLLVGLLAGLILLYAVAFGYQFAETQLGPFAPLAAVLVLGLATAIVGPWLLVRERMRLVAAARATGRWLWVRVRATGLPQRFAVRFPRLAAFLRGRVARTPTGLTLTLGLIAAGALAWTVLELAFEVVTGSPTVGLDQRILNLVATLRAPGLDQALYVVTFLGNAQTIVVLTAVAALIALIAGRPRAALLLVLAVVAGALFFEVVKFLVQRPRPPLEDARLVQGGFSFPSGHSTLAATCYGTIAYLLMRGIRRDRWKVLVGVVAALLVLAIGVSRIYLGVHYPSDVLAGWAAGALWVAVVFLVEQVVWAPRRLSPPAPGMPPRPLS
ncbi:MAG TPA: phosphatase PAP2 family protein, partial [Ktedonobacterales bacterium]|nr:phosphatase PAP2 family protein [Ktedonobacterales bacterium]